MDWKELLEQRSAARAPLFFQLATVTLDGGPANRTVTFRGFHEDAILFTTDRESEKVDHLRRDGRAEVCWYRTQTREQFRITGSVRLIDAGSVKGREVRDRVWRDLSEATQRQFALKVVSVDLDGPPASFVLGILVATRVRYLDLRIAGAHDQVVFPNEEES